MNPSENLLDEAKSINAGLSRVRQNLLMTLQQTETAAQLLENDGTVIGEALQDHKVELRGALKSTNKRLDKIRRLEEWERYALWGSLTFFMLVVMFIFLSRFRVLVNIQYFFMTFPKPNIQAIQSEL